MLTMIAYHEFKNKKNKSTPSTRELYDLGEKEITEDFYINQFLDQFISRGKPFKLIVEEFNYSINEGIFGSVIGGLTGLALGKAIGGFLVRVFQLQPGSVLHKILTSTFFYIAVGAAIGKSGRKEQITSGGKYS